MSSKRRSWESGVLNYLIHAANCNSHERWGGHQSSLLLEQTLTYDEMRLIDIANMLVIRTNLSISADDPAVARYDSDRDTLHWPGDIGEHRFHYGLPVALSTTLVHCAMHHGRANCSALSTGERAELVDYVGLVGGYCLCAKLLPNSNDAAFVAFLHETFEDTYPSAELRDVVSRDAEASVQYLLANY